VCGAFMSALGTYFHQQIQNYVFFSPGWKETNLGLNSLNPTQTLQEEFPVSQSQCNNPIHMAQNPSHLQPLCPEPETQGTQFLLFTNSTCSPHKSPAICNRFGLVLPTSICKDVPQFISCPCSLWKFYF